MQPEREHLSPERVAWRLGVSADTVYRLIRRGELRAVQAGRRYSVPPDALAELLERQEHDDEQRFYDDTLRLAELYVDKAQTQGVEAYYELACAKLRRAIALRPNDLLAKYELVRALLLWGKEAQAKTAFDELERAQAQERRRRRLARATPGR